MLVGGLGQYTDRAGDGHQLLSGILASAHQQGCRYVLGDVLPHGHQYDAVRAVNPFLLAPTELESLE